MLVTFHQISKTFLKKETTNLLKDVERMAGNKDIEAGIIVDVQNQQVQLIKGSIDMFLDCLNKNMPDWKLVNNLVERQT